MYLLINEFSAIGQADTTYQASVLVRAAFDVIRAVEPIRGNDPILTHSSLFKRQLSSNYTIHEWAIETKDRDMRTFFLKTVTKGPFIDKILDDELEYHECYFNKRDVSSSSIAGAAFFEGALVSFQNTPEFTPENIQVVFGTNGNSPHNIEIPNLTRSDQVNRIRRNYSPSLKHDRVRGWGTKMDLDDRVAQKVLDNGIQHDKQVYGCYDGNFMSSKQIILVIIMDTLFRALMSLQKFLEKCKMKPILKINFHISVPIELSLLNHPILKYPKAL